MCARVSGSSSGGAAERVGVEPGMSWPFLKLESHSTIHIPAGSRFIQGRTALDRFKDCGVVRVILCLKSNDNHGFKVLQRTCGSGAIVSSALDLSCGLRPNSGEGLTGQNLVLCRDIQNDFNT